MYKLLKDPMTGNVTYVQNLDTTAFIPLDPANTDYVNFKSQINNDEAELEDADGNLMSPDAAKAFVKELP